MMIMREWHFTKVDGSVSSWNWHWKMCFLGHPLTYSNYYFSVFVGTNTVNPNSLTHTRGFIGTTLSCKCW